MAVKTAADAANGEGGILTPGSIGGLQTITPTEIPPNHNVLIYGESGSGKTRFAGSATELPELCPMLVIDIEGGAKTLQGLYNENIDIVRVTEWSQLQKVYDELYKGKHKYKSVCVDSLTEAQKLDIVHIMSQENPGANKKGFDFESNNLPGLKEWGQNADHMRSFVRAFRDLPITVFFTALAMDKQVNDRSTKYPLFTEKMSMEIPGLMDNVFYLYTQTVRQAAKPGSGEKPSESNQRVLQTDKTRNIMAKTRLHGLPTQITNPTAKKVLTQTT